MGSGPSGGDGAFNGLIELNTFRLSFFLVLAAFLALLAIICSSVLNIRKSRRQESTTIFGARALVHPVAGIVVAASILRHQDGHCTRKRKNWSHGQSNFASRCAMLRMENFQMASATRLVRDLLHSGDSWLPPSNLRGGEAKVLAAVAANRNTCQFRNRRNPLTTKHITFSNRNTNRASEFMLSPVPASNRSDSATVRSLP